MDTMNYSDWLQQVEEKAVAVNARHLAIATDVSNNRHERVNEMTKAFKFLNLFNRFVSVNRSILASRIYEDSLTARELYDRETRG